MTSSRTIALVLILATAGCTVRIGNVAQDAAGTRHAEPFRWDGTVAAGQTVEIRGVNGPIRAEPSTTGRVEIEARRSGRRNDPSQVQIRVVEHGEGVTVCAIYPDDPRGECRPGGGGTLGARNNDAQVQFTVRVPAGAHFTGRSVNGSVVSEDVRGAVRAYSTNGSIRVRGATTADARTTNGGVHVVAERHAVVRSTNGSINATIRRASADAPMSFRTTNGSITLSLPDDFGARVEARTTNGRVSTEMPLTVRGTISRRSLSATLGDGGAALDLSTTNGSISLKRLTPATHAS